jgi:putative colanic acid biosynthesis UDP-glucose lipid carrier transferase
MKFGGLRNLKSDRLLDKMEGRVAYDLEYLRNWSLKLDLYIIFRTIALVFKDAGAY